jgi:ATP-dependent Clp protease ATP-binding subunit ClpC
MPSRLLELLRRLWQATADPSAAAGAREREKAERRSRLYQLSQQLQGLFEVAAHPADLEKDELYLEAVRILADVRFTVAETCTMATGDNPVLSCVALDALRRRRDPEPFRERLLAGMGELSNWARWILCELLEERHPEPVLEPFLKRLDPSWQAPMPRQVLQGFLERRLQRGERISAAWLSDEAQVQGGPMGGVEIQFPSTFSLVVEILESGGSPVAQAEARQLRQEKRASRGLEALRAFARVLEEDAGPAILEHDALRNAAEAGEAALLAGHGLLVCGRAGSGRSTLVRELARRLRARGFTAFEASPAELMAGQSMIGQLEGRLQKLLEVARAAPTVWIVPGFTDLVWAGRHMQSPTGVLEMLVPHLEGRRLRVLGMVEPEGLERLLRVQPRLRHVLEVLRLEPLDPTMTLALARRWAQPPGSGALATEATLREAHELAQHFLGAIAAPGNLFTLLKTALEARGRRGPGALEPADLLDALARLTGLSRAFLDERATLDLAGLRRLFARRVRGQEEAVECLVERVAMLKAGLVDPGRPAGVFLFTGPTGTGKTEIARTLAEFLFGSPERLVRVDMSELSGPLAKARLLGAAHEHEGTQALVHRLREQPFAVVLLDEFEKADPALWDLFLQVFDAGRLTDEQGRTADCRHAIFLLTANVGAELLVDRGLGFGAARSGHEAVRAELARVFRPELLNRLDRVVVFRPLSRAVMREILEMELERVLALRGLRTRQWVIEWDESALDFLLEKGFSPALGARPLRRAIERWFLSPLATTIVDRQAPSGDQFLFVRSDGRRIEVVFVDPDAGEPAEGRDALASAAPPAGLDLGTLALDGRGGAGELAFLQQAFQRLASETRGEGWAAARAAALARLEESGFWERPQRFAVLSEIEFRERIESGLESAERLLKRLSAGTARPGARRSPAGEVVRQLAQQLFLLEAATRTLAQGRPRDAFLSVEALRDGALAEAGAAFARRIVEMYRSWAARRRMRLEELEERAGGEAWRWTAAVSGYGAFLLLEPEAGWHVLERDHGGATQRVRVHVRVAAQPEHPLEDARSAARAAFGREAASDPRVVRRYREEPSPLVRDAVRGWRTGRIERVWAGDFDLVR